MSAADVALLIGSALVLGWCLGRMWERASQQLDNDLDLVAMAEIVAEAKAEALREAADGLTSTGIPGPITVDSAVRWLRARAHRAETNRQEASS